MKNNITIIGLGGAGGRIIEEYWLNNKNKKCLYFNSDKVILDHNKLPKKNKILLGNKIRKGLGCGADSNIGRVVIESEYRLIKQTLKGVKNAVIVGGLAGGIAGGGIPALVNYLLSWSANILVIAIMPFRFEGYDRHLNAQNNLLRIKYYTKNIFQIDMDNINAFSEQMSFANAFKKANTFVAKVIEHIIDK